jgi:molybdopterin-guanine dinucleotide biosynthesis protein A
MPEYTEITAIILAGGKSTRMKNEKGLILFGKKTLVEHVIESLKKITNNIIIITQNPGYEKFGYPCYADLFQDKGALGGIYSGLTYSTTQKNLVVGCDMPFLSEKLLSELINETGEEDVLLTEHMGKAEPLCSIFDKNCITHIRSLIEKNQLKITDALQNLITRVISFDNEEWFKGNEFTNINSIEELKKYEL